MICYIIFLDIPGIKELVALQNNFDSLDNLEIQAQKSSVVQQRAGLVAVYMYKQFIEFHQATVNTNDTFFRLSVQIPIQTPWVCACSDCRYNCNPVFL